MQPLPETRGKHKINYKTYSYKMPLNEHLLRSLLESGVREYQLGNYEAAQAACRQALAIAPDHPDALNLLGTLLLQSGQAGQAVDYLQRAARRQRDNAGILGNLAQAYAALGRHEEAQQTFRKASRLDPREQAFQLGIAISFAMQGKLGEAETLLRRMLERSPHAAPAWFNLGNVHRDQARAADAVACYRKALEIAPQFADARNNLGRLLHSTKRFAEAEREYRECVRIAPDHLYARCNLASVLIDLGRFGEAEAVCRDLVANAPEIGQAHTFLGAALGHQGRLLEALGSFRAAVALSPQDPKIAETYASALTDAGNCAEGLRWFARALALQPDLTSAHQLLGTTLLTHGALTDGWVEYAHRPAALQFRQLHRDVRISRELPSDLTGKHICIVQEQGLGDEIFFLRYAPLLRAAGARVTCRVSSKIRTLLARVAAFERVLEQSEPLPQADAILLAGDLPHALSTLPASPLPPRALQPVVAGVHDCAQRISVFWPPVPPSLALTPLSARTAEMEARLAAAGPPPYLGVTWRGGIPPHEQSGASWVLFKEIDLTALAAALTGFPGTVIALQRNPAPDELAAFSAALGRPLHDFTALNEDLEGMLALLALIDDYVGVSNTNMHLRAGAGRTARVLVPCPAEWRWMNGRRESPWFRGFATYRQSLQGNWHGALAALAQDLAAAFQGSRRGLR